MNHRVIHRLLTMRTKPLLLTLSVVVLVALGGIASYYYEASQANAETESDLAMSAQDNDTPSDADNAIDTASGETPPPTEDTSNKPAQGAMTPMPNADEAKLATPGDIHITVDGMDPKSPRSIGKSDAPVTMVEYSSLTCPHCADAHAHVLPQLIKDYVETGKLRIVFSDFPLNQQALDASKVSRCVGPKEYFGFISMLFGSIEQWAYSNRHPDVLIQDAVLAGLSKERAMECMKDTELEKALIQGVQDANTNYQVNATPTFIFNNGAKSMTGARPYAEFKATIDGLLAKAK